MARMSKEKEEGSSKVTCPCGSHKVGTMVPISQGGNILHGGKITPINNS